MDKLANYLKVLPKWNYDIKFPADAIVTRHDARFSHRSPTYRTGKKCLKCGVAGWRQTSNGKCLECK